jgi:hypothetical protein
MQPLPCFDVNGGRNVQVTAGRALGWVMVFPTFYAKVEWRPDAVR